MKRSFLSIGLFLIASSMCGGAVSKSEAENLRYSGTVVDADGKPVAGALVELFELGRGPMSTGAEMKPEKVLTTAGDGDFEFRAPVSRVVFASKPGLAPAWTTCWNPQTAVTDEKLVLTSPSRITGVLVDETDKPVTNTLVWIAAAYCELTVENGGGKYGYLSVMPHRELFSARTGPDGKFSIEGCPAKAAVDLAVSSPGRILREPERQFVSFETMRCRPGKEVKLALEPAGSVEGKVRSEASGQPLADALISLQRQDRANFGAPVGEPVRSGPDGKFAVSAVAAGNYRVHANFGTNELPDLVAESVAIHVEAGKATRDIEISATKGGFLEVSVLGKEDRQPVPSVSVGVFKEGYQAGKMTGSNGLVVLRLPPGAYQVTCYRENSRSDQASATVEPGKTNRLEVEIAQPARIAGVVRDPSGAPVADLELRVLPSYRANVGFIKTDAEGRFEFPWNPQPMGGMNSVPCIVARDPKRNLAAAQDLEEGGGNIELKLQPGLTIAGRVEDLNGKPLTNASVHVYLWAGNSGDSFENKPIKTDAHGNFEIAALPLDRRYSASASAKGYGSASSPTQSGEGDTNRLELPAFALRVADRQLAGEVVDAEDKPVAGAWVNIYGNGQPNSSARTDEQGRFRFEEVCEGRLQVSANARNAYGSIGAEGGDTNVVLKLGVNQSYSFQEPPKRASLKGKSLPDLAELGLSGDCAPTGKPVLLCLFDLEQRPCRRFLRLLAEQHDALHQKGLTILGLQASVISGDSVKEWKDANPTPFPIGQLPEKSDKTKWASDVQSLPWLILTDTDHKVLAEGFGIEEIEAKLKESK